MEYQFWALLFFGSWLAATISGAAGFGGALILLPLLISTIGATAAIPVLTIAQLMGNLSRAWFGRTEIKWEPVAYFIIGAVPFSIIGAIVFVESPTRIITTFIGLLLIGIVLIKRLKITKFEIRDYKLLIPAGALVGFLSALAGSAGPLGAAFFLGLNLTPVAYVASEAVTAVSMHVTKTIAYQRFLLVGCQELIQGLFLGIAMILGSYTGKRIIEKIPREKFVVFVELLLVIAALQLITMSWL